FGIPTPGVLARHHDGADTRDVGLERQRLQVEQQLDVFLERARQAHRLIRHGEAAVGRLRLCDALLDIADGVEVFAQLRAVTRAELVAEAGDLPRELVKEAAIFRR